MGAMGNRSKTSKRWLRKRGTLRLNPSLADLARPYNSSQLKPAADAWNLTAILLGVALSATMFVASGSAADRDVAPGVNDPAQGPYRDEVLSDSPVAYWRLDELSGTTASDSSGNGNHATYVDGMTLGAPSLLPDDPHTAARANGTTGYIESNSVFLSTTNGITVEAWFALDSLSADGAHVLVQTVLDSPTDGRHILYLEDRLLCWLYTDGASTTVQCMPFTPIFGRAYYLAVTHDYQARELKFYIDGILCPEGTLTQTDNVVGLNNRPVKLAAYNGQSEYLAGVIEEVAIYDRVLPASRIAAHYEAGGRIDQDLYVAPPPDGNDQNDGTAARPLATLQHAADAAVPGTTVHVAPGTYSEAIESSRSGTSTAPIRFVSDTKWGAKIRPVHALIAWENYGSYVDIVGFDVSGDESTYIGIDNEASHVRIIGNHVHDILAPSCIAFGGAGIDHGDGTASHDNDTLGNIVHDVGDVSAPLPCDSIHGIYQHTPGGHIWNNIVYRAWGYGIVCYGDDARDTKVANNLMFRNGYGGFVVGSDRAPADNFTVTNNTAMDNGWFGFTEVGLTGTNNSYKNNLCFINAQGCFDLQNGNSDEGTLTVDPKLIDYQPDGSGDYSLQADSPCIDAGTGEGAPSYDFDGLARPQGLAWDIGPYEFSGSAKMNPVRRVIDGHGPR